MQSKWLCLSQIGQEYRVGNHLVKPFKTYHTVPSQASLQSSSLCISSRLAFLIFLAKFIAGQQKCVGPDGSIVAWILAGGVCKVVCSKITV